MKRSLAASLVVLLICNFVFGSQKSEKEKSEKELAALELKLLVESEKIIKSKYKHYNIETFDSKGRINRNSDKRCLISGYAIASGGKRYDFYVFFILEDSEWKPWQCLLVNETVVLDKRLEKLATDDAKSRGPMKPGRVIVKPPATPESPP